MKTVTIRPITPGDDAAIAKIIRQNLKAYHLDIPGTAYFDPELDSLSGFYGAIPQNRGYFVVENGEGTVIGGVGIAEFPGLDNCAELQKLYLSDPGNPAALDLLRRNGILSQMNVSSFDGWLRRRKASAMVREGKVHLFGSDCHNLSGRKPNWDLVPESLWQSMDSNSKALLRQYLIRK